MTTGDVVYSLRFSLIKILPEPGFDLGSTAGESCVLTAHSIIFLPTIFNYFNDRERGVISFCKILVHPNAPLDSKMLLITFFNNRDEGRYYFCRILAPPMRPPPPLTPQYLTILMAVRGGRHYLL